MWFGELRWVAMITITFIAMESKGSGIIDSCSKILSASLLVVFLLSLVLFITHKCPICVRSHVLPCLWFESLIRLILIALVFVLLRLITLSFIACRLIAARSDSRHGYALRKVCHGDGACCVRRSLALVIVAALFCVGHQSVNRHVITSLNNTYDGRAVLLVVYLAKEPR